VAEVMRQFGQLDILVNNAGIGGPTALARDVSNEAWQQTIDVNLSGAFYCAKYASAPMIAAGRGAIVNIASVAGRIGFPHRTPYAASKWGMIGLSHSLAAELGPHGIRVNAVLPGAVDGPRFDGVIGARARIEQQSEDKIMTGIIATTPLRRLTLESEVASAVVYFSTDASAGITGQALGVDGGLRMQ
jgi:NAD(P)-dependent dehydrogenase (short-subunit alcohol dehydrogenase family)